MGETSTPESSYVLEGVAQADMGRIAVCTFSLKGAGCLHKWQDGAIIKLTRL